MRIIPMKVNSVHFIHFYQISEQCQLVPVRVIKIYGFHIPDRG
jgi:hypothetical protein